LAYLRAYFGADTAIGHRLRGQCSLWEGSYGAAFEHLSRAIAMGATDAETWYLLGDAAWKLDDLLTTEKAYRAALDAPIQVPGRRPWHLSRLATLLASTGRINEALAFQQEAVRLSDYYSYSDYLAMLYAQLGDHTKAQSLCARARVLAGAVQQRLLCEPR
jgi:tetratricopeptide (TPR) repeat protein